MDYLKLVKIMEYKLSSEDAEFDTCGYLCRIKVLSGNLFVSEAGTPITHSTAGCFKVNEEVELMGKMNICGSEFDENIIRVCFYTTV